MPTRPEAALAPIVCVDDKWALVISTRARLREPAAVDLEMTGFGMADVRSVLEEGSGGGGGGRRVL